MARRRLDKPFSRRSLLRGAAASTLVVGAGGLAFPSLAQGAGVVRLRLLETTDVHVFVHPYDYYRDRPDDTVGLARTASLIQTARAGAANSILVDNGDFLQGNPMGDYMAYERGLEEGDMHPIITAMNATGFDVATLGNHEFNYGLSFLDKALAGADFPLVSANVVREQGADPTTDITLIPPYVILERDLVEPYEPPAAGAPTGDDTGTGGSADADDRSTGAGGRSRAGSDEQKHKTMPQSAGGGQTGGAKPGTTSGSASAKAATGQSGSDG